MANPNWRDFVYQPPVGQGQNVTPPMSGANVQVPASEITPAPDTSGLYAIYGQRNPYSAEANRYSAMAGMDMGGRLGQLPGIVATILGNRATAKSEKFEADKAAKIEAFLTRKEAYDKIKNERETRQSNAKYLSDTVFPAAQQEYARVLSESKDMKAASSAAAQVANKMAADQGIPAPEVVAFNAWKGAASMSVINDKGETTTAIYKDGAMLVQNKKGDFEPPNEKWLSLKDAADMLDSKSKQQKAGASNLRDYDLTAIGTQLNSLRQLKVNDGSLTPEEEAQYQALNAEFNRRTGVQPAAVQTPATTPASEPAPKSFGPTPVAGGGVGGFVAQGGQPQGQPAKQPIRRVANGKIALFDPDTKQFLRWE